MTNSPILGLFNHRFPTYKKCHPLIISVKANWQPIFISAKMTLIILLITCIASFLASSPVIASAASNSTVSLNPELTYLLPPGFQGNASQDFLQTVTGNRTIDGNLAQAELASFISYDQEFLDLLPSNASLHLVAEMAYPFADELGAWVWDRDEVWFTGPTINGSSYLMVLDLSTSTVYSPNTSIPVLNPNGGYYYDSLVYIAGDGDVSSAPAIYAINPSTGETSIVVDSYFGLRFNGPNDLTWVSRNNNSYLFFTDDPLSSIYNGGEQPQLPDAVWRFDPQQKTVLPVIDRSDLAVPNGIRVNANQTKLFITNTPPLPAYGANSTASSAIYVFDLDDLGFPHNKRLFGIAERGISDGIHLDDSDRVWTGESDGIVVRNKHGRTIGLINSLTLLGVDPPAPLVNFALAGNKLVILALNQIWTLELAAEIVSCPSKDGSVLSCLS